MAKIRVVLAYEGLKPPEGLSLFTRKGVDRLESLGLEPINCYLGVIAVWNGEIRRLNLELRQIAGELVRKFDAITRIH